MGIHRSAIRRRRRVDAANTKLRNGKEKTAERTRRDARMAAKVKGGSPPFTPAVMSWLSEKLNKKAGRITADDVRTLVT
ncbi:MAG: hypothetical protein ACE5EX_09285 [Phycisphaerae bacterium]